MAITANQKNQYISSFCLIPNMMIPTTSPNTGNNKEFKWTLYAWFIHNQAKKMYIVGYHARMIIYLFKLEMYDLNKSLSW